MKFDFSYSSLNYIFNLPIEEICIVREILDKRIDLMSEKLLEINNEEEYKHTEKCLMRLIGIKTKFALMEDDFIK